MKRITLISAALLVSVTLAGCSTHNSNKPSSEPQTKQKIAKHTKDKTSFDGKTANLEDCKIEILKAKVIPVGQPGNDDGGDKPVLALWLKMTNLKDDQDFNPGLYVGESFGAYQNKGTNRNNLLSTGTDPDSKLTDSQPDPADIQKGKTYEEAISYQLDDTTTPVILRVKNISNDNYIGKKVFDIKKLAGNISSTSTNDSKDSSKSDNGSNSSDNSNDNDNSSNGDTEGYKQQQKNNSGEDDGFDPNNYSDTKKYDVVLPDPEN